MATAPLETGADEPQSGAQDNAPTDYEARARAMGWRPADEFKGEPDKHIDAETFVKRGDEFMPILKAQNRKLLDRLDKAEKAAKQAAEFFSKAETRAYERALAEIRAEQEAAVESGDVAAHRAAAKKLDSLEKPTVQESAAIDQEAAAEALADWGRENKWYASNAILRSYADAQAEILLKSGLTPGPDHLAKVTEKVRAKFPEEFEVEAKPKPRSPVDGGNRVPPARGGKSFADLPADAKAQCARFVKMGVIKSEADYVKSYQW